MSQSRHPHFSFKPQSLKGFTIQGTAVSPTKAQCEITLKCPQCQSERIGTRNYAKKTGGTIGTVAGAAAGVAGVMSGAEIGAAAGLVASPVGAAIGGIAGAIIGGLFGGAAGCAAGTTLGEVIDDNVLDNYHCLDCDYPFSKTRS